MRYIKFTGGNGYCDCGCGFEEYAVFEDGYPDEFIDQYAEELAEDNGEMYESVVVGWGEDFETEEERESYYEDCWCNWEEITKEEYEEKRNENW